MTADLGVEYAGQKPYEVRFSLDRDGNKFIGRRHVRAARQ